MVAPVFLYQGDNMPLAPRARSHSRPTIGSTTVAIRAGGTKWRQCAELIYEYMRREVRDAEEQRKLLYPDTYQTQVQRTVPLIWRMAREMATLYLRDPDRKFFRDDGATPLEEALVRRIKDEYRRKRVNRRLRTAQEHLCALGNATVWVWLTSDGYRLLTPPIHDQWAFSGRVDGQEVDDVAEWRIRFPIVTDPFATHVPTAIALITPEIAVWESGPKDWVGRGIWPTADANGYVDPSNVANPFGRIPCVYLRSSDPAPGEFFCPVPEDSLDAQRAVNHDFTDQGAIARKQGYSQAYAKGLTQAQARELEVGPESVVGVPETGEYGYAAPQADLAGYGGQLDAFIKMVIACSGMSPATVMKSTGITALAKIVENIDREVERQRSKDEFDPAEQRLYDLMQQASELRSGGVGALPRGVVLQVTHREPVMPADPQNDAQAKQLRVQMRIDSAASVLAAEKAISIEKAQEMVLENDRLQREVEGVVEDVTTTPEPKPAEETRTPEPTEEATETQTPPPPGTEVQKEALNGAQMEAMKAIVIDATAGVISARSARALMQAGYPNVDVSLIDDMLADVGTFSPLAREPVAEVPPA